jgi:hypothetical protein
MKNVHSIIGKELEIFLLKFDNRIKVGALTLKEQDLKSEADCVLALQKAIKNADVGQYSVHLERDLFASFNIEVDKIRNLHQRSLSTGAVMPCWNFFEKQ